MIKEKSKISNSCSLDKGAMPNRKLFLNLTNHPSVDWNTEQMDAAKEYGEVNDYAFPSVDPEANEESIDFIADNITSDIIKKYNVSDLTIHLMGEFTMTVALLRRFQHLGITCIASTTKRNVVETEDGKKLVEFKFVRFRRYL